MNGGHDGNAATGANKGGGGDLNACGFSTGTSDLGALGDGELGHVSSTGVVSGAGCIGYGRNGQGGELGEGERGGGLLHSARHMTMMG